MIQTLKKLSEANQVAFVRDKTLSFIVNHINKHHYQSMLEIGSGIGYSAIQIASLTKMQQIVTIEKDQGRYSLGIKYLSKFPVITAINEDAHTYVPTQTFDFIFVDGPKSYQKELVIKYLSYLNKDGTIIIDNIFLKKITNLKNPNKNQKKLIQKITNFKKWLFSLKDFKIQIIDIDDGIAVIN